MSKAKFVLIIKDFPQAGQNFETPIEDRGFDELISVGGWSADKPTGSLWVDRKSDQHSSVFAQFASRFSGIVYENDQLVGRSSGRDFPFAMLIEDNYRINGKATVTDRRVFTFNKV